jgi:hypothetical protein
VPLRVSRRQARPAGVAGTPALSVGVTTRTASALLLATTTSLAADVATLRVRA